MRLIDTHTHLYLEQFDDDRHDAINSAIAKGIDIFLLPNIDKGSIGPMLELCKAFPENCFPMMGLHPTSVEDDFEAQLELVEKELSTGKYIGVGEIGMDLYWDKTYQSQQERALRFQIKLALHYDLPVAIHTRDAFAEILTLVEQENNGRLRGVFHCFSGSAGDAQRIIDMDMMMGIGGVITYKKSNLPEIVQQIPLEYLILETDSPFLAPVPYRGKRNESGFLLPIAQKLAEVKNISLHELAEKTTANAIKLFNINS